jgi:epoxyqueuosine reductase
MHAPALPPPTDPGALAALADRIRGWARELGFQQAGIAGVELGEDATHLRDWLAEGQHGRMEYMRRHGELRTRPEALVPGTLRVVSVRMDYGTGEDDAAWATLADGERAYVARYALGRDYHKVLRNRLQKLADFIAAEIGPFGHRVFTDSAPVLERALARNSGLGWIGKNTCLIHRDAGSWFFLGELFVVLPLPVDAPATAHCGTCRRCIDVCPTQAIVAANRVDARRCISYLTIELDGPIPEEFRAAIGNRIFGCDDCQLVCPWNKFARRFDEPDFRARNDLDRASLVDLFAWTEAEFLQRTEGSAIRRTGYRGWRRNLAIALGNAPSTPAVLAALDAARDEPDDVVREHVHWALRRHEAL